MSRIVKDANLALPTTRRKLARKKEPHWRTLVVGRAHLGWQRGFENPGDQSAPKRREGEAQNSNKSIEGAPKRREAGKWILRRYIDGKYTIRTLGWADDREEANGETILSYEMAETMAKAMIDGPDPLPGRLTVRKAMENYIEHQRDLGKPVGDLISRTEAWIIPSLGNVLVQELTTERLRRWLAAMAATPAMVRSAEGAKQKYKAEPATEDDIRRRRSSANRVWTMLRAGLNLAFKDSKVASDLAWRRVQPFKSVDGTRTNHLTMAQAERLINASDREFKPLLRGALETGCRYSELTRLEVADFNPDSRTVHIRRSKSGETRHVALTDDGVEFFRQVCAGRAGRDLMFQRSDGSPWTPSAQARPMLEACARAKIDPPITFHALRHSWASLAAMDGVPLQVVARNLGHSSTRMVEKHYGHWSASYVADEIRKGAPKFGRVERKVLPIG
jgi:integrase